MLVTKAGKLGVRSVAQCGQKGKFAVKVGAQIVHLSYCVYVRQQHDATILRPFSSPPQHVLRELTVIMAGASESFIALELERVADDASKI